MIRGARSFSICSIILSLLLVGAPSAGAEEDDLDALFEAAFGVRPEPQPVIVDFIVSNTAVGEGTVLGTQTGRLHALVADEFMPLLDGLVSNEAFTALENLTNEDGLLLAEMLRRNEYTVEYDSSRHVVRVRVPPSVRPEQRIDLAPAPVMREYRVPDADIQPARVGGGMRLRTTLQVPTWSLSATAEPFVSFAWGTFQGGLTTRFETDSVALDREPFFFRTYSLDGQTLVTIGDLTPVGARYHSRRPIIGASVRRENLQESIVGDPLTTLNLDERAHIQIRVNDALVFQEIHDAGQYAIGRAAVRQGLNLVEIRLPDSDTPPITLWIPYDSELVRPGEHDFFHAFGLREQDPITVDELRLTSLHRYGFSEAVSAGIGAQFSTVVQQVSSHLIAALPFGTISADVASSNSAIAGTDIAFRLGYSLYQPALPGRPSLRAAAGWTGRRFTHLDRPTGNAELPLVFSAAYGRTIASHAVHTTAQLRYDPEIDLLSYRIGFGVTAPVREATRISGRVELSDGTFGGTITIRSSLPSRTQFEYRQNLYTANAMATVQTSGTLDRGTRYIGRISTDLAPGSTYVVRRTDLSAGLAGDRGGLSGDIQIPLGAPAETTLSLDAYTGFLFAGNAVSWTDIPGNGPFVLVAIPRDSLLERVTVRAGGQRIVANRGPAGTRALFLEQPFDRVDLSLRPEGVPLGYEMARSSVSVAGGLRTGSVVRPDVQALAFTRGFLTDQDGDPIGYAAAYAYDLNTDELLGLTFTTQDGRFELAGLLPGRTYRLESLNGAWTVTFGVPGDVVGLHNSGTLIVEERTQ